MTPADLAAALGVDVERARIDQWDDPVCEDAGARWSVDTSPDPDRPNTLRYSHRADGVAITIPITTTLNAAVAHVRAMLAVPEPTP